MIYIVFQLCFKENINSVDPTDIFIGNSVGEYTALCASGTLDLMETVKLLKARGRLMQKACENRKC